MAAAYRDKFAGIADARTAYLELLAKIRQQTQAAVTAIAGDEKAKEAFGRLRELERADQVVQRELARLEAHFQAWRA